MNRQAYLYFRLFVIVSFIGLSMQSEAQVAGRRLDSLFSSLNEFNFIHGNVLVAEKGTILYKHSFGFRNIESQTKNDDSTAFELASLSKVFTAVAVMQLYEKRKLKLDDPVIKYLAGFPYPEITIRQLLSHTSGLPDFQIFDSLYKQDPERIMTNADIIPALRSFGKPALQPGEKWNYSSPGIGLLALIVEKISKMSFSQYLTKNIFRPASMQHTYINLFAKPVQDSRRAIPYTHPTYFAPDLALADTMRSGQHFLHVSGGVEGPGLLVSTAEDLLRFDQMLYSGKILKQSSITEMYTPVKLNDGTYAKAPHYPGQALFGLGWFIIEDSSMGKIVFHSGYKTGTSTILLRNLLNRQTVILLDNGNSASLSVSGVNAMRLLNNQKPVILNSAITFTYGRDLIKKGPDYALIHFQLLRSDTVHYTMAERDWIAMGYEFFRTQHIVQSLETFKIGYLLYPRHAFLCQLYADVLAKAGKKEEAIWMYRTALRLNPDSKEAAKGLSGLLEN
jgi:CubicO group peptidase (beta-lactamase class C family)